MKSKTNARKVAYIALYLFAFLLLIGTSLYFFEKKKNSDTIPNTNNVEENHDPEIEEPKREEYNVRLGMIGDALYHTGCYKDGLQSDGSYNFDKDRKSVV